MSKESIFMKGLAAIGLAEDDGAETSAAPASVTTAQTAQPTPVVQPVVTNTSFASVLETTTDPNKDAEIQAKLTEVLNEAKLPAASYFDFVTQLAAMEKMLGFADERTRFMAAFAALAAQGVTVEKILDTAPHYKNVLASEEGKFGEMLQNRLQVEVKAKLDEQVQIDAAIADLNTKIQNASAKIMELNTKKLELGNEAAANKASLEVYSNTFTGVKTRMLAQIDANVQKLSAYLNVPATK